MTIQPIRQAITQRDHSSPPPVQIDVSYVVAQWRREHPGQEIPDGHIFTQPWPAGPAGGRRDQVYYTARPHQGIAQRVPDGKHDGGHLAVADLDRGRIYRKPVLGGLINEYSCAAWHPEDSQVTGGSYFSSGTCQREASTIGQTTCACRISLWAPLKGD